MITIKTNKGSFSIELDEEKAPISSANFISYVNSGFYKGTIFHRVIKGFMIQGGGFDEAMNQKETLAPIKNEASNGLKMICTVLRWPERQILTRLHPNFLLMFQVMTS